MCEKLDRTALANSYHEKGYSCAQAVACAFCDMLPYAPEELAPILGCFGGGFRSGETVSYTHLDVYKRQR